jgi:hypothetical protein
MAHGVVVSGGWRVAARACVEGQRPCRGSGRAARSMQVTRWARETCREVRWSAPDAAGMTSPAGGYGYPGGEGSRFIRHGTDGVAPYLRPLTRYSTVSNRAYE